MRSHGLGVAPASPLRPLHREAGIHPDHQNSEHEDEIDPGTCPAPIHLPGKASHRDQLKQAEYGVAGCTSRYSRPVVFPHGLPRCYRQPDQPAAHHLGSQRGQLPGPEAQRLLITADGGGSNGSRLRLWKRELQNFADETGISVTVCHYPPGTSKWNKIEHRLFCHISQNWRGKPLSSRLAIVELIAATTTTTGLTVRCELDTRLYEKAIKVSNEEYDRLNIERDAFHPEWNYTLHPRLER